MGIAYSSFRPGDKCLIVLKPDAETPPLNFVKYNPIDPNSADPNHPDNVEYLLGEVIEELPSNHPQWETVRKKSLVVNDRIRLVRAKIEDMRVYVKDPRRGLRFGFEPSGHYAVVSLDYGTKALLSQVSILKEEVREQVDYTDNVQERSERTKDILMDSIHYIDGVVKKQNTFILTQNRTIDQERASSTGNRIAAGFIGAAFGAAVVLGTLAAVNNYKNASDTVSYPVKSSLEEKVQK
jgi:hypothetical protein